MPLFPIRIYRVAERSMEPKIKEGSYVFVNCFYKKLNVGDAVVFRSPEKDMILVKRIASIDEKRIFVVGDNGTESRDSRIFGTISRNSVIGRVFAVV